MSPTILFHAKAAKARNAGRTAFAFFCFTVGAAPKARSKGAKKGQVTRLAFAPFA